MSRPSINPFRDVIVADARRSEAVVRGLNDQPLAALRQAIQALVAFPVPRPLAPAGLAQLVFSEEPGLGKSHLISRLFRELFGQATLIYVRPFQDPRTSFAELMRQLVEEIHFPDRESDGAWDRDRPTQLDLLAHFILAHVVADFIEGSVQGVVLEGDRAAALELRADPLGEFNRGRGRWADWLNEHWPRLEKLFENALAVRSLRLRSPQAWLRVLKAYAFSPFDATLRRLCCDWMRGLPLESDEAQALGLRAADLLGSDPAPEDLNRICRERLHDLGELSSFFRPFVFCFDQTEVYAGSPSLAHAFGTLVATLVNEVRGHLTLVTANTEPWIKRITPHMEDADRDRLAKSPLFLQGLNRAQAEELVRLRLRGLERAESESTQFLRHPLFTSLFPAATSQMGTRAFLQKCDEAWTGEVDQPDLETLFVERRNQILADPKRHGFDPAALQWLVQTAAQGLPGVEVMAVWEKYANIRWSTPERTCFFGFVPGSNWKQWLTIARSSTAQRGLPGPAKFIFFRAPGQPAIPGPTWQAAAEINRARRDTLHIISLPLEELADLYAPRELFAAAAQGDIPFTTEEVIAFVQQRHARYWARFAGPIQQASVASPPGEMVTDIPQPGPLAQKVRAVVEQARFLSLEDVLAQLGDPAATRETVLAAAGFSGEIRLHTHPKMTVLQWQPRG